VAIDPSAQEHNAQISEVKVDNKMKPLPEIVPDEVFVKTVNTKLAEVEEKLVEEEKKEEEWLKQEEEIIQKE
jgi:hypothetical protein